MFTLPRVPHARQPHRPHHRSSRDLVFLLMEGGAVKRRYDGRDGVGHVDMNLGEERIVAQREQRTKGGGTKHQGESASAGLPGRQGVLFLAYFFFLSQEKLITVPNFMGTRSVAGCRWTRKLAWARTAHGARANADKAGVRAARATTHEEGTCGMPPHNRGAHTTRHIA